VRDATKTVGSPGLGGESIGVDFCILLNVRDLQVELVSQRVLGHSDTVVAYLRGSCNFSNSSLIGNDLIPLKFIHIIRRSNSC
jgi:hypothetical protein